MDDEKLNISVRKFLKKCWNFLSKKHRGESREKVKSGDITNSSKVKIKARITSDKINLDDTIEGEIEI